MNLEKIETTEVTMANIAEVKANFHLLINARKKEKWFVDILEKEEFNELPVDGYSKILVYQGHNDLLQALNNYAVEIGFIGKKDNNSIFSPHVVFIYFDL